MMEVDEATECSQDLLVAAGHGAAQLQDSCCRRLDAGVGIATGQGEQVHQLGLDPELLTAALLTPLTATGGGGESQCPAEQVLGLLEGKGDPGGVGRPQAGGDGPLPADDAPRL